MDSSQNSRKEATCREVQRVLFDAIKINQTCIAALKGRRDYLFWKKTFDENSRELLEIIKIYDEKIKIEK